MAQASPTVLSTKTPVTTSRPRCDAATSNPRGFVRSRLVFSAVVLLASLVSTTSASPTAHPSHITAPAVIDLPQPTLVVETQSLTRNGRFAAAIPAAEYELRRRNKADDEDSSSAASSKTEREDDKKTSSSREDEDKKTTTTGKEGSRTTLTVSVTRTPSSEVTSAPTAAASTSPLPKPFDNALPADFKKSSDDSCPTFIWSLLDDDTFQKCYPVSIMMQSNSDSFFNAKKQLLDIVRVLDASCSADLDFCTDYMKKAADNLKKRENCGDEYEASKNKLSSPIMQAYNGLRAYNTMYKATCLQDASIDMYCYATVVTNTSMPSDNYIYFLPFGIALPSSTPSCNQCTKDTMAILHGDSADRSQLIATTYEAAAQQINTICGPNFVDATLPPPKSSGFRLFPHLTTLLIVAVATLVNLT